MAGVTKTSKIECARDLQEYWAAAGMKTRTTIRGGVKETRPDFWVVRVSLLGLSEPEMERMVEAANAFPKAKVHRGTLRAAQ